MNESKDMSKIDIKREYHQIELKTRGKGDNHVHNTQKTLPIQAFKLWDQLYGRNVPEGHSTDPTGML